jgi:hypothetical protein
MHEEDMVEELDGGGMDQDVNSDSEPEDGEIELLSISPSAAALVRLLTFFLLKLQGVFHLSNSALTLLFGFLSTLFVVLGRFSDLCKEIAKAFPRSLLSAQNNHSRRFKFQRYVVCRKCHRLSYFKDSVEGSGSNQRTKLLFFLTLSSSQTTPSESHLCLPFAEDCRTVGWTAYSVSISNILLYLSLELSLQSFIDRHGFIEKCEQWKNLEHSNGIYNDVYDGKIWRDFQVYDGVPFLQASNNLAIMMNMDFFQPYKHVKYSVGAIYM